VVDDAALKALGAHGILRPSARALQVVLGPIADVVAVEIRDATARGGVTVPAVPVAAVTNEAPVVLRSAALAALGGAANVVAVSAHDHRLRIKLADASALDADALNMLGVRGVARPARDIVHLLADDSILAALRG